MRKLFAILAMLFVFSIAPVQAQSTDVPADTPVVTVEATQPAPVNINITSSDQVPQSDLNNAKTIVIDAVNLNNPVFLILLGIVALAVIVGGGAVIVLLNKIFKSLPLWEQEAIRSAVPRVEQEINTFGQGIQDAAALTPNPVDDYLAKWLTEQAPKILQGIVAEAVVAGSVQPASVTNINLNTPATVTLDTSTDHSDEGSS